jgi:hypothetical protein
MAALIDSVMATTTITNNALTTTVGSFTVPTLESGNWVIVEIAVTQDAWLNYNVNPTSANGEYWPAGMVKCKKVIPGSTIRYASDSTDGRITFGVQI